jgi:hypothetical protein
MLGLKRTDLSNEPDDLTDELLGGVLEDELLEDETLEDELFAELEDAGAPSPFTQRTEKYVS